MEAKKGQNYKDKIHDAFDALEESVKSKVVTKFEELIGKNLINVHEMESVLGLQAAQ